MLIQEIYSTRNKGDFMNWSKAKTILIVALIVTNALLAYTVFSEENPIDPTLDEAFILKVEEALMDIDIGLDTPIPTFRPSLLGLTVEYEMKDIDTLNQDFFGGNGDITHQGEGFSEINFGNEILSLINKKMIIYESSETIEKYNIENSSDAIDVALKFLEERNFDTSDTKTSFIRTEDDLYTIEFTKIYGDNFLESTFTNVQVDKTGVKNLHRSWLNVISEGSKSIYIDTAPKSLLSLLSENQVQGKDIIDISLCYYFAPDKHDYIDEPNEARRGRAIPAWRITFHDGYKIFIDNY